MSSLISHCNFFILIMLQATFSLAQEASLAPFNCLIGDSWKAEGTWGDGSIFKQEISFEYSLDKQLIVTKTSGFTDQDQSSFGQRNLGIRKFDQKSTGVIFWEFDIFGGVTKGTVSFADKDIIYKYKYGNSSLTETWKYVDDDTYNYIVGVFENGKWQKKYLETQYKRLLESYKLKLPDLSKRLSGSWTSPAWDGILNETWKKGSDGHMYQQAQYLENGIVLFESESKIEIIGDDIILFSVIKDDNPKIFKATSFSTDSITFENTEYNNPNKVVYDFSHNSNFQRTISGRENDKPTSYTFYFKPQEH